jgi:hypothetical protein
MHGRGSCVPSPADYWIKRGFKIDPAAMPDYAKGRRTERDTRRPMAWPPSRMNGTSWLRTSSTARQEWSLKKRDTKNGPRRQASKIACKSPNTRHRDHGASRRIGPFCRDFPHSRTSRGGDRTGWLGREDLYGAFEVKHLFHGILHFLPSSQFLCSTWNPVSSPRPTCVGRRRAQGLSRPAVALSWPHTPLFPGRALTAPARVGTLVVVGGMTIRGELAIGRGSSRHNLVFGGP